MLQSDIKILWGRSGNRCAICKLELTPDGNRETIGEMAHIVARSPDGPRGNEMLPIEERDRYDNLILLCPNHHREVDGNPKSWSVGKLRETKQDHESWVSQQLANSRIQIPQSVDNSEFLEGREKDWIEKSQSRPAIALSLTPLRVANERAENEVLNPLTEKVVATLNSARVLANPQTATTVNTYHTRPTEYGVVNEHLDNDFGRSIHIFRNGHLEYFCELGKSVDYITQYYRNHQYNLDGIASVFRYTDIAKIADLGLSWLKQAWHKLLPFQDMTFHFVVTNTAVSTLYSSEECGPGIQGTPFKKNLLRVSFVIMRNFDTEDVLLNSLNRLVNCYGFVLNSFRDNQGEHARPALLSQNL